MGDLVIHLIAGNLKYTEIARRGDWSRGVPPVELRDDPSEMYRRTVETMLEAWQQPGALDREITLPRGRGRAESALYLHLGETLVHGWDLAMATGQDPSFDVEVVEASLAQYQSWLPACRPEGSPSRTQEVSTRTLRLSIVWSPSSAGRSPSGPEQTRGVAAPTPARRERPVSAVTPGP